MSDFLAAKGPADVVERRWTVPVNADDSPLAASLSASGVTVDSNSFECNELVLILSAGTAAQTGTITVEITTSRGETLTETLYIPICSPASTATTVRDIVNFALRKVTGLGEDAGAEQAEDARERLQDMLEMWRNTGADIGAPRPLTLSTVIYCPESYLSAVKNNLILQIADIYNLEVTPMVVRNASAGLAHIKQRNLPDTRTAEYF